MLALVVHEWFSWNSLLNKSCTRFFSKNRSFFSIRSFHLALYEYRSLFLKQDFTLSVFITTYLFYRQADKKKFQSDFVKGENLSTSFINIRKHTSFINIRKNTSFWHIVHRIIATSQNIKKKPKTYLQFYILFSTSFIWWKTAAFFPPTLLFNIWEDE